MGLHVEREAIVFDPLDDVGFPEGTIAMKAGGVKSRDQAKHLPVAPGFWKRGVSNVIVRIEVSVLDPVGQAEPPEWPNQLLVEGILNGLWVVVRRKCLVEPLFVHSFGILEQHQTRGMHGHLAVFSEKKAGIYGAEGFHGSQRSIPVGSLLVASAAPNKEGRQK